MIGKDAWTALIGAQLCDADTAKARIAAGRPHYVYVLARPDGTPFYVGKGIGGRAFHHEAEARTSDRLSHKLNIIRALGRRDEAISYCVESSFSEEADALARERELIRLFGRHDLGLGPLANQTDGGEGASNPSEESRERRRQNLWGEDAADEERRAANRFFQKLCSVQSVPIKPLSNFKPERLYANRSKLAMSPRQAAALAASAILNGVLLAAGAVVPRLLSLNGVLMAIENGVGRDILSSGMATLGVGDVGRESVVLTKEGYRYVISQIETGLLVSAGIVEPCFPNSLGLSSGVDPRSRSCRQPVKLVSEPLCFDYFRSGRAASTGHAHHMKLAQS